MRITIAAFAVCFGATSVAAAPVLDQDSFFDAGGFRLQASAVETLENGAGARWQAQSVVAGLSGTLARVDLWLIQGGGEEDLLLRIGRGQVTDAGFEPFATFVIPRGTVANSIEANAGAFATVDVSSAGFDLVAGDRFSLFLEAEPGVRFRNNFGWVFGNDIGTNAVYEPGVNRFSTNFGASWQVTGVDRAFRTWVDPAAGAIPEPGTWAMMVAGFGLVGMAARRRLVPA